MRFYFRVKGNHGWKITEEKRTYAASTSSEKRKELQSLQEGWQKVATTSSTKDTSAVHPKGYFLSKRCGRKCVPLRGNGRD